MSVQRHTSAPEQSVRRRDWTCWASALLIALMLLVVLACGGEFLYTLSHRHEVISYRGEGHAISRLHDAGPQPSALNLCADGAPKRPAQQCGGLKRIGSVAAACPSRLPADRRASYFMVVLGTGIVVEG